MLIKVEFASFAVDPDKNTPLILLRETGGTRVLPVPVGPLEASAIAMETLGVKPEKPLTIDVAKNILEELGGVITRVILHEGPEGGLATYLECAARGRVRRIECRPSDAIALALRCRAPLLVRDHMFEKYSLGDRRSPKERLRNHIASLDTLDFGGFYLE